MHIQDHKPIFGMIAGLQNELVIWQLSDCLDYNIVRVSRFG